MNDRATARKIVDELKARETPEPPAGLRERILEEVPEALELAPEVAGDGAGPRRRPARWMLAAASVVLAVGAGVVGVRVMHEVETPSVVQAPAVPETRAIPSAEDDRRETGSPPAPAESASEATAAAPEAAPAPLTEGAIRLRVSDTQGDPLPGARIEVSGGQAPRTAFTDQRGQAELEGLPPGRYELEARLEGFSTVEYPEVDVRGDRDTAIEVSLSPALEEAITVTSESPLLDERKVARGTTVEQVELEKVPTARDPWDVVTQTPGVLSDRVNVGGTETGQQAVFKAPAESDASGNTFSVDGVQITDMASVGSSPTYYEFDQLEELEVPETEPPPPPRAKLIPKPQATPEAPLSVAAQAPPSTGGTAEPNDQPYGDVFFRTYGTNPFLDTEDDPLSTFALDVDTGSYGVVRRYLSDGHLPPPEAVRVEELVNAFDYGDPAPAPAEDEGQADFALFAEGSRTPFMAGERYRLVRFAVKAREVSAADRKPAVLTFVVDVSGSMGQENRLGLVKRALGLLLDELRSDDRVALVIYGSRGGVVLDHTGDLAAIRRAIDSLRPEGSTNAEEGLTLGYELARRGFREGAINRVILCSDGVANVGATGPDSILERIGDEARRGVELTTVGFGMGNYNDVLMERLADQGDGVYAYVDTLDEARRVFVENLTGTLQTVARDAKVQVEFDPAVVARYRLLGYENRDVPDELFRDDTVDAGEVGVGHTVTALYEVKLRPEARSRATAATLHLRWRSAETGRVVETARAISVRELSGRWEEAPRALRLASVVAELAEILKGSYWAKDGDLDDLFRRAQKLSAEYPGDLRVAELATLIGKAASLARPASP